MSCYLEPETIEFWMENFNMILTGSLFSVSKHQKEKRPDEMSLIAYYLTASNECMIRRSEHL